MKKYYMFKGSKSAPVWKKHFKIGHIYKDRHGYPEQGFLEVKSNDGNLKFVPIENFEDVTHIVRKENSRAVLGCCMVIWIAFCLYLIFKFLINTLNNLSL